MKQKLLTLMTLLLCAVSGAWADTELVNIDFTDAAWSGKTFSQGNTTTADIINGVYFYSKSAEKQFSLANNTTDGLTFPKNNMSSGNYYFCIPLTGINKKITITLKHAYSSNKASFKYVFIDGRTEYVAGNTNGSGGTQVTDKNNADTEITFEVNSTNASGHLCIGRQGSGYTNILGVTVTTPEASGKADPELSVTPASASLVVGGTQQLTTTATSTGAVSYESSNTSAATVSNAGLITAVAVGNANVTVSIAETGDYDADTKIIPVMVKSVEPTLAATAELDTEAHATAQSYFTLVSPGDYNTKYNGTYNGTNYTSGLKLTSDTQVKFTNSTACDLVVVQSIATNPYLIKIDGTTFASDYSTKYYYDDAANKVRVYTVKNIAAGTHAITRTSELGLLYIGVTDVITPTCATPVISPADGSTFGDYQSVTITCETGGAAIHYTTDGTTPNSSSATYSSPFNITNTTTIKAIAVKADYDDSDVATAKITKINQIYDRGWSFDSWSDDTKTGVLADATNWHNQEKASSGLDFDAANQLGRSNNIELSAATLQYGSTDIPETKGLEFNASTDDNKRVCLMFNLPSTDLGTYKGSQFIWLQSSSATITIPDVLPGSIIGIGVESHNSTNARGITLSGGGAVQIAGDETSTTYQDVTWKIPNGGDVKITPSKGLHIYYITIFKNSEIEPVSSFGWSTYITKTAASFAANTAYVVTEVDGSNIVTEAVTSVPANTPILLKGEGNKTITPLLSADDPATNLLSVSNGTANGTKIPYVLAKNGESAGFKKWTGDIAKLNGRVVLWLDAEVAARDFFSLDETTGINKVSQKANTDNQYYNLAGQRVAQPTKGLYIVNGKKVIIK